MVKGISQEYASKTIEHLGLVSTMYDELCISEVVNQAIVQDQTLRFVNLGQLLKAILDHKMHLAGMVADSKWTWFHATLFVLKPALFQ